MKAITYERYGPPEVLRLQDVERPVPKAGEVLIAVRAASLNPLDWHLLRGSPYLVRLMGGLRRPKRTGLGVDVAGRVEAVGSGVTELQLGDEVFGSCRGALAEYACTAASALVRKPQNLTFEEAAAVPVAALTALQGLRDFGRLRPAQRVVINGAAGGVGTFAVQIAKWLGAEVTGVCSARNLELIRSLGADHAIDYARADFTRGGERYDAILDCIGNHPVSACRRALRPKGRYLLVGGQGGRAIGPFARAIAMLLLSPFVSQSLSLVMAKRKPATTF